MKDENTQEVAVVAEMALVAPVDAEQILETFRKFEWLKSNVIGPDDRQKIGDTSFIKKSGWLKVALSCNLSLEKREERVERDDGDIIYHYTFRAIASSGRFADADGSASSSERAFTHVPHDIRTLAQTRACNRSIANLVGGGEVSAEEMDVSSSKTTTINDEGVNPVLDKAGIIDALESAGLDIEDLEITVDKGKTVVKPTKYLAKIWDKYNQELWKAGLSWVKDGKDGRWEGVFFE